MVRGERLIKFGYSWFSAKSIEVECFYFFIEGKALIGLGGYDFLPNPVKLKNINK